MTSDWITTRGSVAVLRSELMPTLIARSIQQAMSAMPEIADVELVEKGSQAYLAWQPSDQQGREDLYVALMGRKAAKAQAERGGYTFIPLPDNTTVVTGLPHSKTGEIGVYIVGSDLSCTCKDYEYRCCGLGIYCKHGIAVRLWREETHGGGEDAVVGGLVDISSGSAPALPMTREQMVITSAADFG